MNIENIITLYKSSNDESILQETFHQIINNDLKQEILNIYNNYILKYKMYNMYFSKTYKLFFKFTNNNETHKGFKYNNGFNFDVNEFIPFGNCNGGGLYFCDIDHLYRFTDFGINIRPILIPKDIPYIKEPVTPYNFEYIKYKAPVIYALPIIRLGTLLSLKLVQNTNLQNIKQFESYMWKNNSISMLQKYIENNYTNNKYNTIYAKFKLLLINFNNNLNLKNNKDLLSIEDKYLIICNNIEIRESFNILCNIIESKNNDIKNFNYILKLFLDNNDNSIIDFLYLYFKNLVNISIKMFKYNIDLINAKENIKQSLLNIKFNNTNLYNYLKFNKFLNGCLIAGSYTLKYLLNLDYEPGDIDIYFEFNDRFYDNNLFSELKQFINNKKQPYINNKNNIIKKMINITINHINIQFIFVDNIPIHFIKNSFDFDFCTCCYDIKHENFIYDIKFNYYEGNIQKLYINDMTLENTYLYYRAVNTIERCIKYINRGFAINNINEFLDRINNICFFEYK